MSKVAILTKAPAGHHDLLGLPGPTSVVRLILAGTPRPRQGPSAHTGAPQ